MIYSLARFIDNKIGISKVSAHCDIPCKIYDPITAQLAALTVIRIVDLINELNAGDNHSLKDKTQLIRLVNEKETHGLKVKEEVRVIWGDYFKQPHFDEVPTIHELVHNIMLQASKAKQGVDRIDSLALLALVNDFAKAFWTSKGVKTFTATCPYPPAIDLVYPVLNNS
jgi:nickel superoxide dismutase